MKLLVYSDYVCPFCFLEIPILERLVREQKVELEWRAFELRPEPEPTLDPRDEYLLSTWRESVYPLAERMGIPIQLPPVQPRSRLAFEGAEFAREHGRIHDYNKAVFEVFFQRGGDISDSSVLEMIAKQVGLDAAAFRDALETHRHLPRVLEQQREARERGIHAVPTVIVGPHAVPGIAPYYAFERLINAARR